MNTFIFIYFMVDDVEKIKKNLGQHVKYWKNLSLDNYQGGPFTDKSGGLIIFSADTYEEAEKIISADPFYQENVLKQYWLKEWLP